MLIITTYVAYKQLIPDITILYCDLWICDSSVSFFSIQDFCHAFEKVTDESYPAAK